MALGIFGKIRRHAAIAAGDFATMFREVEIPPLPAAVSHLIAEISQPDPDLDRVVQLISSSTAITAKVIKTVNSSLYALRRPVTSIRHAVTLLGLKQIRSIALAYAVMDSLPKPYGDLFDHGAFWSDSLLRAMLSGSFTKARFRDQMEDAFTASLLADVAVPVLLSSWREYYEPVFAEWREGTRRLSEIEREHFGWDHAQAGAWIVQSWEFPEDMICYIGAHNLSLPSIQEHELGDTILVPMAVASIAPSVLKSGAVRSAHLYAPATEWLSIDGDRFVACVREVQDSFADMLELLELPDRGSSTAFDDLLDSAGPERSVEGT